MGNVRCLLARSPFHPAAAVEYAGDPDSARRAGVADRRAVLASAGSFHGETMSASRRNMLTAATGFALLAGLLLAYDASGLRQMIQPARVATFKMAVLRQALNQDARNLEQLNAMEKAAQSEVLEIEKALEELETAIKALPQNSPAKTSKLDELNLMRARRSATILGRLNEIEMEKLWRNEELIRAIENAIADLAKEEGYDLVIRDDSTDPPLFTKSETESQAVQRVRLLGGRRVWYASKTVDVTEHLASRMNNAFKQVN